MRAFNRLTATEVKSASPGKYADGGGLWLFVRSAGTAQWFFRYTIHRRRREMGLGATHAVSLKHARKLAADARALLADGLDPIRVRDQRRRQAAKNLHRFREVALDAFESRKADLKDDGKAGRWMSPLELHVFPKLGDVPVGELDQIDIRDAISPIWHSKPDAARKAVNRINLCLKHGAALGIDVDLHAASKAKELLGRQRHIPRNVPALNWREVPEFYALLNDGTITHLALRLLILTGARPKPIRFLQENHISGNTWTIPAELMKGPRGKTSAFRVPLSSAAQHLVSQARRHARNGFLFPNTRNGVISDATMSRLMERRGMKARPHGFRSSLRDWVAEVVGAPYEVSETILAHKVGSSVERSYRRTDYLEQRSKIMERWARHVTKLDLQARIESAVTSTGGDDARAIR